MLDGYFFHFFSHKICGLQGVAKAIEQLIRLEGESVVIQNLSVEVVELVHQIFWQTSQIVEAQI